jgi:uncharacterized protein
VGLGWRPELAAGIFAHLDAIDVVEVIADDHLRASRAELRALRTLGRQVPLVLHGVGLGLASTEPVARLRLDALARVVDAAEPCFWSEHLAFVRGGGIEVGHLAAPPRRAATIEGAARNIEAAARAVGTRPLMENVATLVEPPGSDRSEAEWTADVLRASGAGLLLDLHNLHANAVNFGFSALGFLDVVPVESVRAVHLAGGRWVDAPDGSRRLLDDHLHDVPDPVFELLAEVARRAPHDLTVILERDGAYPDMAVLSRQLDRARAALRAGRAAPRAARPPLEPPAREPAQAGRQADEAFLARLYTDADLRRRVLEQEPALDGPGLELAARSFAHKRAGQVRRDAAQGTLMSRLRQRYQQARLR